ncbi:MAG: tyrosine-protein phosphatase [Candidatus Promineofilum sp.]|nr:tyrosine-protein phosphatase [Promineifilum sp.]
MSSSFSADRYVILPPEEAWVERPANGDWLLRWRQPAAHVAVYVSDDPDAPAGGWPLPVGGATNNELRMTNSEIEAAVGGPSSAVRPYFLLELDGRRHVVAERTLPLAGESNFRDLGGYRTADGRAVRWGRVYRAGSLAELTEADVAYLGRLGLRLSCDLRSREEVENHPDRLPPGAIARHTPIAAEVGRVRRLVTLFRLRSRIQKMLQQVYVIMLDQNGPLLAGILRAAADPANLPLVVHCTAGKDRTGLAVALLLLSLGVPEETVIADYTLSNRAFGVLAERMRSELELLYAFGFSEERLRPFLLAEAPTLIGALAHLRRRYGSVEAYLRRAGLTEHDLQRLRETLLTGDG